jgi:CheY-like chemotaxis protein
MTGTQSTILARILIVEDDDAFAYAASRHLEKEGYRTVVVHGSMAAFDALDAADIDLMVTDIRLIEGEPHGLSLARTIGNRRNRIPSILITAYPEILEGEPDLPGPVLHKPIELITLSATIKACLAEAAARRAGSM